MSNFYKSDRTYKVDSVNGNYLIRGNQPLESDEKTFAYDAMNKQLKSIIKGDFGLTNYKLIDVSIINDVPTSDERGLLEAEFGAYGFSSTNFNSMFPPAKWPPCVFHIDVTKQHGTTVTTNNGHGVISSHPGSIIWYPVQGWPILATIEDVEVRQYQFFKFIDLLRHLLETETKSVIYFHCVHGHDRTSAVAGSYMIKYMGASLNDVLTLPPQKGAKAFSHAWEEPYETLVKYYDSKYKNPPVYPPS